MKNKKLVSNYIILILLFLSCIIFVLYLCKIYKVHDMESKKIPIIRDVVAEIDQNSFEYYVLDNPTKIIYLCTANEEKCRNFEKDFKKILKNNDYANYITYLNLTDADVDLFVNQFNSKYKNKKTLLKNYPAFIFFEDGEVESIIQTEDNKELSISKVKQFLEVNTTGGE